MNILIDASFNAQISDFGLTIYANGKSQNYFSTRTSNALWLAPELLRTETPGASTRLTKATDVYSFGLLCIEVGYFPLFDVVAPTDESEALHGPSAMVSCRIRARIQLDGADPGWRASSEAHGSWHGSSRPDGGCALEFGLQMLGCRV